MDLFLKTSDNKYFIEHHHYYFIDEIAKECDVPVIPPPILFLQNEKSVCFEINVHTRKIQTNYYIGVDWLIESQKAICIEPKLNKDSTDQVDYLKMLFSALKHSESAKNLDNLFEIKWDKDYIEIEQQQDFLTPLLVVQFLSLVKEIVRKGLKKSYYKVENNLYAKVKGKVLISQTIKQNLVKNKPLHTYCNYDEFGLNGLENRLLKKALVFVQRYLPNIKNLQSEKYTTEIFNYINPAFEFVSEEVNLHDAKHTKTNPFYKEYEEAIKLAKLILKRFGYTISNTQEKRIKTPPFWIDMSKLFELYVFAKLKEIFPDKNEVKYHQKFNGLEPDFILNSKDGKYQMVVDAKYKQRYSYTNISIDDIRQVSGYARMKSIYKALGMENKHNEVIDCLIIYSDQESNRKDFVKDKFLYEPEDDYVNFYKIGIALPVLKNDSE
ncbi:5-methylcytosine restriction system specificity protein McrC [Flavobacterium oreochromis]|uniref:5-methylcytosine restriction system specificity protein McrC n=1 Tax=Flavobacterium oreochromis TaxID=2906078 RepID=UPI0038590D2F